MNKKLRKKLRIQESEEIVDYREAMPFIQIFMTFCFIAEIHNICIMY